MEVISTLPYTLILHPSIHQDSTPTISRISQLRLYSRIPIEWKCTCRVLPGHPPGLTTFCGVNLQLGDPPIGWVLKMSWNPIDEDRKTCGNPRNKSLLLQSSQSLRSSWSSLSHFHGLYTRWSVLLPCYLVRRYIRIVLFRVHLDLEM